MKGDAPILASFISPPRTAALVLEAKPKAVFKVQSLISGGNLREACELVLPAGNKEDGVGE